MKIAITAQTGNPDAAIDMRFGRAAFLVVYDTESKAFTAHSNEQNRNAAQGAGIQVAQNVARLGAEMVITGHVGPKAFATLQAAKIKVYVGTSGTVKEAIDTFHAGKLQAVNQHDVPGHWV